MVVVILDAMSDVTLCFPGLQRVHEPRGEPTSRAESDATDCTEGNRPNGVNHPTQVHRDRAAAETEHVRSGHDSAIAVSRRAVSVEACGPCLRLLLSVCQDYFLFDCAIC